MLRPHSNDFDGASGVTDDGFGYATEQGSLEAFPPMRAEYD
jgi:hypothetical protein